MSIRSVKDTLSYAGNYTVTKTSQKITQVATNPSALKKVLQIATKTFALFDHYQFGKSQDRPVTGAMKGTIELIEFYGTFRDIMFWINPFSKETLDDKTLLDSLKSTMVAPLQDEKARKQNERLAKQIFKEVVGNESFHSKGEVREAVVRSLEHHGYKHQFAEKIANSVVIQQKARPITLLFSMACFTSIDLLGNVLVLKKWGLVDLSHLAAEIGSKSRVFGFVMQFSIETVFGTVASAALIVTFSEATYRALTQAIKHYQSTNTEDKEKAYQELRKAILDMLASGTDLVSASAPLFFTLSPPVVIGLAIVAKGTGLICILIK